MKLSTTLAKFTILATALAGAQLASAATTIVAENFAGTGSNLNGTTADTFASGITTAGGSSTWAATTAAATFFDDGSIASADNKSAYLNMGLLHQRHQGNCSGQVHRLRDGG